MRILLLQLKRIGDAILTAPALAMLREALPDAHLELILHGPSGGLAGAIPGMNAIHTWQAGHTNLALLSKIAMGNWDAALDFTGTDRSFFLTLLSRAHHRASYSRHFHDSSWRKGCINMPIDASVSDLTTVDYHAALVRGFLTARSIPYKQSVPLPPTLRLPNLHIPASLPANFALIHPGTARKEKYWQAVKWAAVARDVHQSLQMPVVITGSNDPMESAHIAELLENSKDVPLLNLAGTLDLLQSAAVIGRSSLALTVDSAAMHIAAQFARPQVALFGPTNPYHWAPRHGAARILQGSHGLVDPESCRPPIANDGNMLDITVENVLSAVDSLFPR